MVCKCPPIPDLIVYLYDLNFRLNWMEMYNLIQFKMLKVLEEIRLVPLFLNIFNWQKCQLQKWWSNWFVVDLLGQIQLLSFKTLGIVNKYVAKEHYMQTQSFSCSVVKGQLIKLNFVLFLLEQNLNLFFEKKRTAGAHNNLAASVFIEDGRRLSISYIRWT